jgi:hypothetical protein
MMVVESVISRSESRKIVDLIPGPASITCRFDGGSSAGFPGFLGRFIRQSDVLRQLGPGYSGFLLERPNHARSQFLLYTTIGYVAQPKTTDGDGFLLRAELPEGTDLRALFLSGDAVRRYFYGLHGSRATGNSLYALLGVSETATATDLHTAWRIHQIESDFGKPNLAPTTTVERAFNLLASPELRRCYDELLHDDAPPLFPYSGFGSILVEGTLSKDGDAFFADRILAYKPEMRTRKVSLLLRRCEFLTDRVVCRDRRRRLEVWLDSSLLGGIQWDLSWNQWKHWLRSRIEVDATFVHTGKYRLHRSEWILRAWYTALPSRLHIELPGDIASDIERAKAIHALLGEHADALARIRAEIEKQPVEHVQIQEWFDRIAASRHLRPQHVTWRPDYDLYYFEQLRKRSATWFLFEGEYLFVLNHVLISEVPQPGHATYVFRRPSDLGTFMTRYSKATREDVRTNRGNAATDLGFVGRIVRGKKKKRWLADVLKLAGEKADYMEVFE